MHILWHLIPWNVKSCTMGTEDGSCRILDIALRIITNLFDHCLCVPARFIAAERTGQMSLSSCIGIHFHLIIPHTCNRCISLDRRHLSFCLRCTGLPIHPLNICKCPSDHSRWNFQLKIIIRFQQHTFGLHQSLAHRTVGCLPEIPAFGMFQMCPSCRQCDLHIRDHRTCQHTPVFFFQKMGKDQTLPVLV